MVSKNSSCLTWYCGDARPVDMLSTRLTLLACNGEGPHVTPDLVWRVHFGTMLPPWTSFWRAKTGQPKVWFSFILVQHLIPAKSSSLEWSSSWEGTVLWMWTAYLTAYGHRAKCRTSGHLALIWSNYFQACLNVSNCSFSNAILVMGIYSTVGDVLLVLLIVSYEGIVSKAAVVKMVMLNMHIMTFGKTFESFLGHDCFLWDYACHEVYIP